MTRGSEASSAVPARRPGRALVARRLLPAALSAAAFAYLFSIVDLRALTAAMRGISAGAWLSAAALTGAALGCGVLRWWLLFLAFGAPRQPRMATLTKHYALGFFYNTYLPGGVSGDLVRGLSTQRAFDPGSAGGFATVVVERALGLCALLGLVLAATLAHPGLDLQRMRRPALMAFAFAVTLAAGLSLFGFVARALPAGARPAQQRFFATLERWLSRLPVPHAYAPLLVAWLLSLVCQLAPALAGHVLLRAIAARAAVLDSMAIIPLANAAAFLPFSVSGAGIRETVFVELYARVGVPARAALAAALCLWATQALLAGLCGVYVLLGLTPRATDPTPHQRLPQ